MYNLLCILLFLSWMFYSKLIIIEPFELKELLNEDNEKGSLNYSVSLFGDVLYNKVELVQIFTPEDDNIWGCE